MLSDAATRSGFARVSSSMVKRSGRKVTDLLVVQTRGRSDVQTHSSNVVNTVNEKKWAWEDCSEKGKRKMERSDL